jgi:hypothetical protein
MRTDARFRPHFFAQNLLPKSAFFCLMAKNSNTNDQHAQPEPLVEGIDYYLEKGYWVLTEHFLRKRGYCCGSGCRHCPYKKAGSLQQH